MPLEHVWYNCPPGCDNEFCPYCVGGLGTCTVCTASEGELLPSCPGFKLTAEQKEACYRGKFKGAAELRQV